MLEVVEHEQDSPFAQIPAKRRCRRFTARARDGKGLCDRRRDELGISQRPKSDKEDAVDEVVEQLRRNL